MAFDWNEYILLATDSNSGSPSIAQMRSSTSRAYYGAFNLCRIHLGYTTKKGGDIHQTVITELKTSDIRNEVSIGNLLDDLRRKRNDADYNGFHNPTSQTTQFHIKNAERIVTLLKTVQTP